MIMTKENTPEGAILQRDGKSYAIVPRIPVGLATPDQLEKIAAVARKYAIPIIKLTAGHRLALVGIEREMVDAVYRELAMDIGRATELCLHYVQTCPGTAVCRFGVGNSLDLAGAIEDFFLGMELPAKVKIGVSGCAFNCAESLVRDVGLFAKKKGWTVTFGGNAARFPRIGDELARGLDREEAMELVKKCLAYYKAHALHKERTARFIRRTGIEAMRHAIL